MYELFCLEVDFGFTDACVPVEDWISFSMLNTKFYLCIEKIHKQFSLCMLNKYSKEVIVAREVKANSLCQLSSFLIPAAAPSTWE